MLVVAAAILHTVVIRVLLAARGHAAAAAIATDIEILIVCSIATWTCWRTARGLTERHLRIAWLSITAGLAMWWIAGIAWSYREIVLGLIAPAPSLLDAPFFALAPSFAFALIFYRRRRPHRALQIRQLADIGILAATILLIGTLVLAVPLRSTVGDPYVYIAIGYPGLYLAVVLAAFVTLVGHAWGPQRVVLGLLVCAHLMFAVVDLLYGAKVLVERYQTELEDTLWLVGMLLLIWAAHEERSLQARPRILVDEREPSAGNAIVGAVVIVALGALGADRIAALGGLEWTVMSLAVVLLAGCIGLRVWASGRLEDAYATAVEDGASTARALVAEREAMTRLRGVGPLAGGTAHEVNNLLQAIAGNFALLRRRSARREDIEPNLVSIQAALKRLGEEVAALRRVAPDAGALIVVVLLPGGDPDGLLAPLLADAGYAPAFLPTVEVALRAAKSGEVHAIVGSASDAEALADAGTSVPVVVRGDDLLQAVISVVNRLG